MNNIPLIIDEIHLTFKQYPDLTQKQHIQAALKQIQENGEAKNVVPLLHSIRKDINELQVQTPAAVGLKVLKSVDNVILDELLKLPPEEQNAFLANNESLVKEIICGSDMNAVRNGDTLFHQLCCCKSPEMWHLALECLPAGFDVNRPNNEGYTGLHLAALHRNFHVYNSLIPRGANHSAEASNKATAFDLAFQMAFETGDYRFVKDMLLFYGNDKINNTKIRDKIRNRFSASDLIKLIDAGKRENVIQFLNSFSQSRQNIWKQLLNNEDLENVAPSVQMMLELTGVSLDDGYFVKEFSRICKHLLSKDQWNETDLALIKGLLKSELGPFLILDDGATFIERLNTHPAVTQELKMCIQDRNRQILEQLDSDSYKIDRQQIDYIISKDRPDLIAKYHSKDLTDSDLKSKIMFGIFLDKMIFLNKKYEGFKSSSITAHALNRALNRIVGDKTLPDHDFIQKFHRNVSQAFTTFIFLASKERSNFWARNDRNDVLFARRIAKNLESIKPGEILLIPSGCLEHATCIMVTKMNDNTFSLIHYNTGYGLSNWHYKSKKRINHCQTFWAIDHIPPDSIVNETAWTSFKKITEESSDMNPVYTFLKEQLGKGGTLQEASKHEEDYEAIQKSGTCGSQCLMAMLRHQVMSRAPGTVAEKEAFYKAFKSKMFTAYSDEYLPKCDAEIQKHIPSIMKKFAAEEKLLKIADAPHLYEQALGEFKAALHHYGEELPVLQSDTTMARYAALRVLSNLVIAAFGKHPNKPLPEFTEALALVVAKFEYREGIFYNVLKQKNTPSEIADTFYKFLRTTPSAVDELLKHVGENNQIMDELLKLAQKNRDKNDVHIVNLIEKIAAKGNTELAECTKNKWDSLKST